MATGGPPSPPPASLAIRGMGDEVDHAYLQDITPFNDAYDTKDVITKNEAEKQELRRTIDELVDEIRQLRGVTFRKPKIKAKGDDDDDDSDDEKVLKVGLGLKLDGKGKGVGSLEGAWATPITMGMKMHDQPGVLDGALFPMAPIPSNSMAASSSGHTMLKLSETGECIVSSVVRPLGTATTSNASGALFTLAPSVISHASASRGAVTASTMDTSAVVHTRAMPIPAATAPGNTPVLTMQSHLASETSHKLYNPGLRIPAYTYNSDVALFLERMEIYFISANTRDDQKIPIILGALDDLTLNAVLKEKR